MKAKLTSHGMCVIQCIKFTFAGTIAKVSVYKLLTLQKKQHGQPIHKRPGCHKNWSQQRNSNVGLLERSWPQHVENPCVWVGACVCASVYLDPNSSFLRQERELMRGWHFAGICRTLKHFYVWDLGFWYPFTAAPHPSLSELLARYSDFGTLYECSCCWPVQGLRFLKPAAVTTQICGQEPVLEQ